jgi:hypothetical protein
MGGARAALVCLALTGCAVAEYPYPAAWDPLVPRPDSDCREFQGSYADRGERDDDPEHKPSLTRELFGDLSDWEEAKTVRIAATGPGVFEVTVSGDQGRIFSRKLDRSDYACRGGRLIVRDRRWVVGYIMSGRQHVEVELNDDGRRVVAQVEEIGYGVMFIIFPVVGTGRHWYRFERLAQ